MHEHRGRVALLEAQSPVRNRSGRRYSIAILRGGAGSAQADNQVFDQLWEVSGALVVAHLNLVEFFALFGPCQPVFDNTGNAAPQDRAYSLLFHPGGRLAV